MGKKSDLPSRVSEALGALLGRPGARPPGDAPREPGLLESATGAVADFLERQAAGIPFLRFQPRSGRDMLVAPGEPVELSVRIDPVRGLAADRVRFRLGSKVLGESPVGPDRAAYLLHTPDTPGLFRVEYDLLGAGGRALKVETPDETALLHVVDDRPAAAVAADLILERATAELDPVADLVRRGWQICYLDLAEQDRTREIREAIARHGLPDGAVLVHPTAQAEFKTLGVDFRGVFAHTTWRRLRAAGVPLALLVSGDPGAFDLGEAEGASATDLGGLAALLARREGIGRAERRARAFVTARNTAQCRFTWRLDRMTGIGTVAGNRCHVEFDNRAARAAVLDAVEQALQTLHLQFYIFKDSGFTEQLAVRLIARARAGVRVRLMVDALYSAQEIFGITNRMLEGLSSEPNIEVVAVDPIRAAGEIEAVRLKHRNHRKFVIADGTVAFVSGRNAGDEYYTSIEEVPVTDWTLAERIPWLDSHIEVRGPLVREIQSAFLATWNRNGGSPVPPDEAVPPELPPAGGTHARLVVHEGLADSAGLLAYEAIIDAASSHVFVLNDFPVVASLAAALRRAATRGVEVVFLTGSAVPRRMDGSFFKGGLHRELFEYMTKKRFEPLILWGVRVSEYVTPSLPTIVARGGAVRPYVHAKVVTADGRVASIGSANLDATASYWESEANVVVEDADLVGRVESEIRRMIERSYPIRLDSDYWKQEIAQREIVSRLWPEPFMT